MRVTFQGAWTSSEDSTGEFNAMPKATPQNAVFFWEDVYPIDHGKLVKGVPTTASGLLHYLQTSPKCVTTACAVFLSLPQWTSDWGIAYKQVQRFYLADVKYGGVKHLFVAVIYPDKGSDLKTFAKLGEQLLRTRARPRHGRLSPLGPTVEVLACCQRRGHLGGRCG